jgi:hypothetical protein
VIGWLRFPPLRVAGFTPTVVVFGVLLSAGAPAHAQMPNPTSQTEFKQAYESAMADAQGSDSLDPAYELLGVAGNAHIQNLNDMANKAAEAFASLIQRATLAAHRKGGGYLQDTLDQMAELRFTAETTRLPRTTEALDNALRTLFPAVAHTIEQRADTAATWDEEITALHDLVNLEASATQLKLADVVKPISMAVDTRVASMESAAGSDADTDARTKKLGEIADFKHTRTDQLREAAANDVNTVAHQIETGDEEGGRRQVKSEDGGPGSEDLLEAEGSCVETGFRIPDSAPPPDADTHRAQQRECINSDRVPVNGRCSTDNLSLVCYTRIQDGERITYAYRGTAAEAYLRQACPAEDLVPGVKVPKTGAAFRAPDIQLAFVCAPSEDSAGN